MFRALLSLLQEKEVPGRSTAAGILTPLMSLVEKALSGPGPPEVAGTNGWMRSLL